jgi:hypothetical protein
MDWEGCVTKQSRSDLKCNSGIFLEGLEKNTKILTQYRRSADRGGYIKAPVIFDWTTADTCRHPCNHVNTSPNDTEARNTYFLVEEKIQD